MKRKILLTTAMAALTISASSQAKSPEEMEKLLNTINQRTQSLEGELKDLRKEVSVLRSERAASARKQAVASREAESADDTLENLVDIGGAPIVTSPYIGVRSEFDMEPLVDYASINIDRRLIEQRYQLNELIEKKYGHGMRYPIIEFSPRVDVTATYQDPYTGGKTSDIDLTEAKLSTYVMPNNWSGAYIDLSYTNAPGANGFGRVRNSNVSVNLAFLSIGDLSKSPFYATAGQLYVPFGRYGSFMVSPPITMSIGRTKARALIAGFTNKGTGFYGAGYVFRGDSATTAEKQKQINNYGANLGYRFKQGKWMGKLGVGMIHNLADSQGIASVLSTAPLKHNVPGLDIKGRLGYGSLYLLGEYVTATRAFDPRDLSYNGRGAKPQGYNAELGYRFDLLGKQSTFAVGHGGTSNAYALGLSERRYAAVFHMQVWKNILASIEYRQDKNYKRGTTGGSDAMSMTGNDLGKTAHTVSARIRAEL